MSLWIAMHYPPPIGLTEGVWVEAEDEDGAAVEALEWFDSEAGLPIVGGDERTPVEHFFVVPADNYVAYRTSRSPVRAQDEFQCCGGPIEFVPGGHSGYCPTKTKSDERGKRMSDPRVAVVSTCETCGGTGLHPDPKKGRYYDTDGNFNMRWSRDGCPERNCNRGQVTEWVPAAELAKRFAE